MDETVAELRPIHTIGLAKLFLWPEAERIQTYPEAFARLQPDRTYTKREVAVEVFRLVYTDPKSSKALRHDQIRNCFGWAPAEGNKVVIHGINCLRQVDEDRYQATETALQIGQAYKSGRDEADWTVPLARQLARFEVRTRLTLYLLGWGGWQLEFVKPDFFALPSVKARLTRNGESIAPFENNSAVFNELLQAHRHIALGPWWETELEDAGYFVDEGFRFAGIREDSPATNKLGSNIKAGLFLMKYLGVVQQQAGGWALSPQRAVDVLGEMLAGEFVDVTGVVPVGTPLQELNALASELRNAQGYVVVSRLAARWAARCGVPAERAEDEFETFIRAQMHAGSVHVVDQHQGQPRQGRGLFGNDGARMVKLEVIA